MHYKRILLVSFSEVQGWRDWAKRNRMKISVSEVGTEMGKKRYLVKLRY